MSEVVGNLGEKNLLRRLEPFLGKSDKIIRSFSEDCAVIDSGGSQYQLFTVDVLIENIHFRRHYSSGFYIGRKALNVNISDISAMGGIPQYYLVSLGIPYETPQEIIDGIYEGMASAGKEMNVLLIGGNVSASPVLFLDLFMIGSVERDRILTRNTAEAGDSIFVTGSLGEAAEGLLLLEEGFRLVPGEKESILLPAGVTDSNYVREAILHQLNPDSNNRIARKMAGWKLIGAMIDLSDGLSSDLNEICRESKTGAVVDAVRLPIAPSVLHWERKRKKDPVALALSGGEDYHLLFTVHESNKKELLEKAAREKIELFEIGRITAESEGIMLAHADGSTSVIGKGFEHFQER